jgi:hypothetical protein
MKYSAGIALPAGFTVAIDAQAAPKIRYTATRFCASLKRRDICQQPNGELS